MCLEGLIATKIEEKSNEISELRYGFEISHRDKIYKVKRYYIKENSEFVKWIECFK
jgi:hypothetical protein